MPVFRRGKTWPRRGSTEFAARRRRQRPGARIRLCGPRGTGRRGLSALPRDDHLEPQIPFLSRPVRKLWTQVAEDVLAIGRLSGQEVPKAIRQSPGQGIAGRMPLAPRATARCHPILHPFFLSKAIAFRALPSTLRQSGYVCLRVACIIRMNSGCQRQFSR